jgi:hypothetical protein
LPLERSHEEVDDEADNYDRDEDERPGTPDPDGPGATPRSFRLFPLMFRPAAFRPGGFLFIPPLARSLETLLFFFLGHAVCL